MKLLNLPVRIAPWLATASMIFGANLVHAQNPFFQYNVATLAHGFASPTGLALDSSGNIYVADLGAHQVDWLTASGASLGAFGGAGNSIGLMNPWGVAVAPNGALLYAADSLANTIDQILPVASAAVYAGTAGTAGSGDGTGTGAFFNSPLGVAMDATGDLYVADLGNDVIREITPGGVVTTIAGTLGSAGTADGFGSSAKFNRPWGIAIDSSGTLYVSTVDSIRKISTTGSVTTLAGSANAVGSQDGTGAAASFFNPEGIAVDRSGNVYVADTGNRTIRMITPAGAVTTIAGSPSAGPTSADGSVAVATFTNPTGVAVSPDGNLIYVADDAGVAQGNGLIRVVYLPLAAQIVSSPQSTAVNVGSTLTLTVGATGGPLPTLQWYLNGKAIAGATGSAYTVASAQATDSGNYTVVASNTYGTATSAVATVTAASPPTLTTAPQTTQINSSGSATLSVAASGTGPFTYQWLLNGTAISGANSNTYTAAAPGSYTVTVTNLAGSVTSPAALVLASHRLANLSTRGVVGPTAGALTAGFVASGPGSKSYLIRAIGPTLSSFGISGVLAQPSLTLFSGQTVLATNTVWGTNANSATIVSTSVNVGAFALPATSADSVLLVNLAPGSYTAQVTGLGSSSGAALVEIYEVGSDLTQLVNVSTRGQVASGQSMTAGLIVTGTQSIQVLLRGIGPALGQFNVSGPLAHPQLTLFSGSAVLATNSGWSATDAANIVLAEAAVGAFALPNGSADAAMLTTLAPGSYTVQVSSGDGTTGAALVEVYQVQ